jgi:hypothetical protein
MTTLDFEPAISPGIDGSYPVIARAPGGEAATSMRLPVSAAELDRQLAVDRGQVLASSAMTCRAPTSAEQPARELGRQLFEAVVIDGVQAEARRLYQAGQWAAVVKIGERLHTLGHRLATTSEDKIELVKVTHDDPVRGVAFSPDGRWLATASADRLRGSGC